MSCIISAPSTDKGKTTLALLISCWAFTKGLKLQSFKVGPDYLDQQQLSSIGHPICRNLDVFLSGEKWISKTYSYFSAESDLSLVEGAMGLFDGLGSTQYSSTANVARVLNLPIVFIVDAKGQVASLLALLKGFREFDKNLNFKGIVFNNVNSLRHKVLIKEVFKNEGIKIIGFLPSEQRICLKKGNLGLVSPKELKESIDINYCASFAEENLDISYLKNILKSKKTLNHSSNYSLNLKIDRNKPIAIADDRIFHFQYPETKEFLYELGIPIISWDLYNDNEIPEDACSLIIPGGFPEKYARHLSSSRKSLNSLKSFKEKGFIYAECGGMMILGESIKDENGNTHKMSGILPFRSQKGKLTVGYRYIKGIKDSLIIKKNQLARGHEFHYWQIEQSRQFISQKNIDENTVTKNPWEIKSWGSEYQTEGWSTPNIHASWVHIHFPSDKELSKNFVNSIQNKLKKVPN